MPHDPLRQNLREGPRPGRKAVCRWCGGAVRSGRNAEHARCGDAAMAALDNPRSPRAPEPPGGDP